MSTNTTIGQGACPGPFLEEDFFPSTGGFLEGRFCSKILGPSCCLPCPQTEWIYPDNFNTITTSAEWINVLSTACSVFLITSFTFLPVDKTHRHYLGVCLAAATLLMQLGFIVPLGAQPNQCFNAITPNDMHTSTACAFSGSFLIAGGWAAALWVMLRAVALHLQICWQLVIGKTFMWCALAAGWVIPPIGLTLALTLSGVSFRFGDSCHINHQNSLAVLWIPLLIVTGVTVILQFATFGYCIKVYLASFADKGETTGSSGLPSYTNSVRVTISPRKAYRRVRRVVELQWRGIAIVFIIVADVIFFAVIFVFIDNVEETILKDPTKALTWLECLVENNGNKSPCYGFASDLVVNEATVTAVLLLLSLNGFWCLFLLGRLSMFTGWYELIVGRTRKRANEFVSADVRQFKDPGAYEMIGQKRDSSKAIDPLTTESDAISPVSPAVVKGGRETPDYFGREARYKSPSRSFSSPKPPQGLSSDNPWDSTQSHARPMYFEGMDPLSMNKI